jgi:hypothetical protein
VTNRARGTLRIVKTTENTTSSGTGGTDLLDEIVRYVRRYVVMSPAQADVVALWTAHTYAIGAAETTPYLHIAAPTRRSGKTRLLEVLEALVSRPIRAGGTTEAALFRVIADRAPDDLVR